VIGMSIAPHKGKETRDIIAQKGKEIIKKGQESLEKLSEGAAGKHGTDTADEVIEEAKHHKKKFIEKIADRIFGRSKKVKKDLLKDKDFRKIPNEVE
jgi:gas vesicle protein